VMYRRHDGSKSRDFERVYRGGRAMLSSHRRHHRNCKPCRRSLKQGFRSFRSYCLQNGYWHSFGNIRRSQGSLAAAAFLARTCLRDPRLVPEVLLHFPRRLLARRAQAATVATAAPQVSGPAA
jgi:hypothetical protein